MSEAYSNTLNNSMFFLQNLYSYEAHCLRNTNKVHFMEPQYNLNLYFLSIL